MHLSITGTASRRYQRDDLIWTRRLPSLSKALLSMKLSLSSVYHARARRSTFSSLSSTVGREPSLIGCLSFEFGSILFEAAFIGTHTLLKTERRRDLAFISDAEILFSAFIIDL